MATLPIVPPIITVAMTPVVASYISNDALIVCILSAVVSGLSGAAALMRTEPGFTTSRLMVVLLNSSLLGLGLSLIWWGSFVENPNILVGLCVLIGLGGQPMLELVLKLAQKGALSIVFKDNALKIDEGDPKPSNKESEK